MDEEEAVEYFNFNVKGSYVGEQTPIWCIDDLLFRLINYMLCPFVHSPPLTLRNSLINLTYTYFSFLYVNEYIIPNNK